MDGFVSTRYELPPDVAEQWFGDTLGWRPALDVTLELVGGGERSGVVIPPGPEVDPDTGGLALWFAVPGKLDLAPVPVSEVVAITVHERLPPEPVKANPMLMVRDLVGFVLGRSAPPATAPEPVADRRSGEVLVLAKILLERDDDEVAASVVRAIEAVLPSIAGLSDHRITREGDSMRAELLLCLPLDAHGHAALGEAMDAVAEVFPLHDGFPGVDWAELEIGDW